MAKVDLWVLNRPNWRTPYEQCTRVRVRGSYVYILNYRYGIFQDQDKRWRVLELRTGMWLCVAPTRKEAIAQAETAIQAHTARYGGMKNYLDAVHPGKDVAKLEATDGTL